MQFDTRVVQAAWQGDDRRDRAQGIDGSEECGRGETGRVLAVKNYRERLIAAPAVVYSKSKIQNGS